MGNITRRIPNRRHPLQYASKRLFHEQQLLPTRSLLC